jgi:PhnB protein
MADVHPVPEGYPQISPYLVVDDADAAISFYRDVFGATERMRLGGGPDDPPDTVGHAELVIGSGLIMLADEFPDMGNLGPRSIGGSPVTISVYVDDVDAVFDRAIAAGATSLRPVEDQFYGDRTGRFVDPWGHRWNVGTHVEDVPPDEMARRAAQAAQD